MTISPKRKIVRSPNRSKRTPAPTKEKLLATATSLIEIHFLEEITSEMVLEECGVSRGSLYHHFEDFSDLLEQALVRKFAGHVDESIEALTKVVYDSKSVEEMLAQLSLALEVIHSSANSSNRYFRARLIGLAESNDRLTQRLAIEQKRLSDTLADLFAEGQRKGWMNRNFDPSIASIFIQAYTLGKVIDDVSEEKIDPDRWNAFINQAVRLLFCQG